MAVVPNTLAAGATIVASELNQNFSALETAITGNLTEASMSASTRLPNSKLANDDFVVTLQLKIHNPSANWINTADVVMDAAPLPYDSTEGNSTYTILSATGIWRQIGATIPDFKIDWGYFDANGAWNQTTAIVASTALSDSNTVTANGCLQSALTLANTTVTTSSSQERVFALRVATTDDWTAAEGEFLSITIKLKRALRS